MDGKIKEKQDHTDYAMNVIWLRLLIGLTVGTLN